MGIFWNVWIIGLTFICMALVIWILFANRKVAVRDDEEPENRTTGHVYDGIEEYDNPLPRWWFQLFVATIIFSAGYLIYYPGLGSFKGLGGWTSTGELRRDQERAEGQHAALFAEFMATPVEDLIHEHAAMRMGMRLFANNCAVCHGADGGGGYGFPDLTSGHWLYGGSPEQIKTSLVDGRRGNMPSFSRSLTEPQVQAVTEYVAQLSGWAHDTHLAGRGEAVYRRNCAACHGADGAGNYFLGAPNLTNDAWLYEGSREAIAFAIRNGRVNNMPAQKDLLRDEFIHVLTAYVYSLSYDFGPRQ